MGCAKPRYLDIIREPCAESGATRRMIRMKPYAFLLRKLVNKVSGWMLHCDKLKKERMTCRTPWDDRRAR